MITWFEITFTDNSTGYQKMEDGNTIGVYRADGTVISPEEAIEYTCTNDNATAPTWYVPPVVVPVVEPTPEA
jgi:hypothetical protein